MNFLKTKISLRDGETIILYIQGVESLDIIDIIKRVDETGEITQQRLCDEFRKRKISCFTEDEFRIFDTNFDTKNQK